MLRFSFHSSKFGETVELSSAGPGRHVSVAAKAFGGQRQVCGAGMLTGPTLISPGSPDMPDARQDALFERACRRWWGAYLRSRARHA